MIIHLNKSKLFTIDPAIRFSREYNVSSKVWNELWKRYGLLEYDMDGLCGYFQYKTGRKARRESIKRWIVRTEIYCLANHATRMGVRVVDSSYFGKFEEEVIKEVTRHLRFGATTTSRTLV